MTNSYEAGVGSETFNTTGIDFADYRLEKMNYSARDTINASMTREQYDLAVDCNLHPETGVDLLEANGQSTSLYFSREFMLGEGHLSRIIYQIVTDSDGQNTTLANIVYLSRSQGLWRTLPAYRKTAGKNDMLFIKRGSGKSEEHFNLPVGLQRVLCDQSSDSIREKDNIIKDTHVLGQFAINLAQSGIGDFNVGVPSLEQIMIPVDRLRSVLDPTSIQTLNEADEIADIPVASWTTSETVLYGKIEMTAYKSINGRLIYTVARAKGATWIANVEFARTELGKHLVREKAPKSLGRLTTPPYEYTSMPMGHYHGDASKRKGSYSPVYGFVRRIPIIKKVLGFKPLSERQGEGRFSLKTFFSGLRRNDPESLFEGAIEYDSYNSVISLLNEVEGYSNIVSSLGNLSSEFVKNLIIRVLSGEPSVESISTIPRANELRAKVAALHGIKKAILKQLKPGQSPFETTHNLREVKDICYLLGVGDPEILGPRIDVAIELNQFGLLPEDKGLRERVKRMKENNWV